MNKLLSTTAIVFALGLPAIALAQTTTTTTTEGQTQTQGQTHGFMEQRGQSDILASELIGHDVLAHRMSEDRTTSDRPQAGTDGGHDMASMNRNDVENMENIGQINEIILSHDGQVRAIVIGVGGFLGMGEQDVAVTMDQVTIARDQDDQSRMYVVANVSADELEQSPRYEHSAAMGGDQAATQQQQQATGTGDAATTERQRLTGPDMARDGYNRVEITRVSTDLLMGATVYDIHDNSVGNVDELIVGDDGTISNVIIDFGGFLGIGSNQVALNYDELTILADDRNTDVIIYVDATREQIQNLPQYQASN